MAQYRNTRTGDVIAVTGAVEQAYAAKPQWERVADAPAVFTADMTIDELRAHADRVGVDLTGATRKDEMRQRIADAHAASGQRPAPDSEA